MTVTLKAYMQKNAALHFFLSRINAVLHSVKKQKSAAEMNDSIDEDFFLSVSGNKKMADGALIGICGESGAGKTVFLTSIFNCNHKLFPTRNINFDPKVGGSVYFTHQEKSIRATGKVDPTLPTEKKAAQLNIQLTTQESKKIGCSYLPLYLLDFAGKHFNSISDQVHANTEITDEETKRIRKQIDDYLHRCDGLIILVNSRCFGGEKISRKEDPFSPSVKYLISFCRENSIAVALLFTQGDLNTHINQQDIDKFEYIIQFKKWFTDDLEQFITDSENSVETLPFGMARLITCYEIDKTSASGKAKELHRDGGIWTEDAIDVFRTIFKAAWPKIKQKFLNVSQNVREEADRNQKNAERLKKEKEKKKKVIFYVVGSIMILSVLGIVVNYSVKQDIKRNEDIKFVYSVADSLSVNGISSITNDNLQRLASLSRLSVNQSAAQHTDDELKKALDTFWEAYRKQFANEALDADIFSEKIINTLSSYKKAEIFFQEQKSDWWMNDILPVIENRIKFLYTLKKKFSVDKDEKSIIIFIDEKKKEFKDKDRAFFSLIEEYSHGLFNKIRNEWESDIVSKNNIKDRLDSIEEKFNNTNKFFDKTDYFIQSINFLAGWTMQSVMELIYNKNIKILLKKIDPELISEDNQKDGDRFFYKIIYEHIQKQGNSFDYYDKINKIMNNDIESSLTTPDDPLLRAKKLTTNILNNTSGEEKEITKNIIETIKKEYIFREDEDTYKKLSASPAYVRLENYTSPDLVKEFFDSSVYKTEVNVLAAMLTKRLARYKTLNTYKKIINDFSSAQKECSGLFFYIDNIRISQVAYLDDSFKYIHNYLPTQIRNTCSSLDKAIGEEKQEKAKNNIKNLINNHCKELQGATFTGDCKNDF